MCTRLCPALIGALILALGPACSDKSGTTPAQGDASSDVSAPTDTAIPEEVIPEETTPAPDVGEPDVGEPDVGEPDVGEPDVGEPDVPEVADTADPADAGDVTDPEDVPVTGCGDGCPGGEVCFEDSCCDPVCEMGTCELDDGCGGTCNWCLPYQNCLDGLCCSPSCGGVLGCLKNVCGPELINCEALQGCQPILVCLTACDFGDGSCAEDCVDTTSMSVPTLNLAFCAMNSGCLGNSVDNAPENAVKTCGDNGCGTTCGECAELELCTEAGVCCLPQCDGAVCGEDGCGGTCGICGESDVCYDGACCEPICGPDYICGDNGCGSSCGACVPGYVCHEGQCCVPSCDDKTCGDDGCGGSCGDCGEDQVCADDACCTTTCATKACGGNGCGGSCGSCEYGICFAGQCQCTPDCEGKACGEDGCGGWCGDCLGNVIASIPAPGISPAGLASDGTTLWVSSIQTGTGGEDTIYRIDPSDGTVLSSFSVKGKLVHGLAWAWDMDHACHDGTCDPHESTITCPADCNLECGDGVCTGENPGSCPEDCGPSCGNFLCEEANGETTVTCTMDCGTLCGDGVCVGDETVAGCAADCQHGYLWADSFYTNILKFTPTGTEVASIPAAGELGAYGLAWDPVEQVLYQSDNTGAGIYKLDPATGEVLLTLEPVEEEDAGWADLAWVDGALWQVNIAADIAYKLDPQTAEVLDLIELDSPHVEGLTFDGTHLWTSDTTTEMLYRLNLQGECCAADQACADGLCIAE